MEKIKKARGKDKEVVRVIKKMKRAEMKNLKSNKWEIKGELVLKKGKMYVLKNKKLKMEVI